MKTLMIVLNAVSHDNRVLKSAQSFNALGNKVEIYGMSPEKELNTKPVLNRISHLPVRLFPNPIYFLNGVKSKLDRWRFMIDYFTLSMWVYVQKMEPKIIYTHDYNTILIGKEIVNRLRSQGKFVYWIHDLHEYVRGLTTMDDEIRELALKHENECIHAPDCLITVSPMLSKKLTQEYGLPNHPQILINAPNYSEFDRNYEPTVRQLVGLDIEVPLIVYVGGVTKARGLHTAIDALAKLPGVHLVIVTNNHGDYIESLKSSARNHQCFDRLHITPYVTPEKVSSFVRDASAAIHPMTHYPNAEIALPNKLFEYMHGCVPLIVSDCDSMGKFVRKWKIGEVFEAENVDDFVDKAQIIIHNRDCYVNHMQEFSLFNQCFSWESQDDFFYRLNQDIERKYKNFIEQGNTDLVQNQLENYNSYDLFNTFYDPSLTNSLFSKYYYCLGQAQLNKGKKTDAAQLFYLASRFQSQDN